MSDIETYKKTMMKIKPSEDTLSEVMKMTENKRGTAPKTLLIAAVISVLTFALVGTAFAYGDEIIQFMFGDSRAEQVDFIDSNTDEDGSTSTFLTKFEIVDASDVVGYRNSPEYRNHDYTYESFSSFEDAHQAAPFDMKKPSYIPDDATLRDVEIIRLNDHTYSYDAQLYYSVRQPDGKDSFLLLNQFYAGPGAYVDLKVVNEFTLERIMIGDIEAMMIQDDVLTVIYWMKDEIFFAMSSTITNGYDLETLLKIADSVGC